MLSATTTDYSSCAGYTLIYRTEIEDGISLKLRNGMKSLQ